jgi:hypothetical protein
MELKPQESWKESKYPKEYKPDVLSVDEPQYYNDYKYWQTIRKLKPWVETEWTRIIVETLTRASSAWTWTQTISKLWFTPRIIKIQTCYISSTDWSLSFWHYNGTTQYVYYTFPNGTSTGASVVQSYIIRVTNDTWVSMTRASISAITQDGFTINWDTMWLDVTFTYECIG